MQPTMTLYDFDHPPDRRDTDSMKWQRYAGRDVIPMWVADMDFAAPPPVLAAMRERLDHGVLGYAGDHAEINACIVAAMQRDYAWQIESEWIVWLPGVVPGFNAACRAVGETGDGVFCATPVYPPMLSAPANADRVLQRCDLRYDASAAGNGWCWDWGAVDAVTTDRTRLFLLCNPHNPVGRIFSREDLLQLAARAEKNGWVICSDEIHCGLVLDPALRHIPIASLDTAIAQRTITLMAPSKTWNIPTLNLALAIIPNAGLRQRYRHAVRGLFSESTLNALSCIGLLAAYRHGEPWRQAVVEYLRRNAHTLEQGLARIPGLSVARVEATYLAWIDCRALDNEEARIDPAKFFEAAGVGLSSGPDFGMPGFVRLNFGTSHALLEEALRRMRQALLDKPGLGEQGA